MPFKVPHFLELACAVLIAGCALNPFASAIGLLVFFTAMLGDRYFTKNLSDADRLEIQFIKSEQAKLKVKVEHDGLTKAFTRGQ